MKTDFISTVLYAHPVLFGALLVVFAIVLILIATAASAGRRMRSHRRSLEVFEDRRPDPVTTLHSTRSPFFLSIHGDD